MRFGSNRVRVISATGASQPISGPTYFAVNVPAPGLDPGEARFWPSDSGAGEALVTTRPLDVHQLSEIPAQGAIAVSQLPAEDAGTVRVFGWIVELAVHVALQTRFVEAAVFSGHTSGEMVAVGRRIVAAAANNGAEAISFHRFRVPGRYVSVRLANREPLGSGRTVGLTGSVIVRPDRGGVDGRYSWSEPLQEGVGEGRQIFRNFNAATSARTWWPVVWYQREYLDNPGYPQPGAGNVALETAGAHVVPVWPGSLDVWLKPTSDGVLEVWGMQALLGGDPWNFGLAGTWDLLQSWAVAGGQVLDLNVVQAAVDAAGLPSTTQGGYRPGSDYVLLAWRDTSGLGAPGAVRSYARWIEDTRA